MKKFKDHLFGKIPPEFQEQDIEWIRLVPYKEINDSVGILLYRNLGEKNVYDDWCETMELAIERAEEFYANEYYRSYYPSIIDETGLLIRINSDIQIGVACGTREGTAPRDYQIQELIKLFPVLASACQQHWSRENQLAPLLSKGESGGEFGATLDTAFANFGRDYLTQRECEIVHLILKGYASKSIAQLLEISVDTVKVHRKRFHAKLEVSSQAELFALFLDAISMVPLGSDEDPLTYYYQSQQPVTTADNAS